MEQWAEECLELARKIIPEEELIWDWNDIEMELGVGVKKIDSDGGPMRMAIAVSNLNDPPAGRCSLQNFGHALVEMMRSMERWKM